MPPITVPIDSSFWLGKIVLLSHSNNLNPSIKGFRRVFRGITQQSDQQRSLVLSFEFLFTCILALACHWRSSVDRRDLNFLKYASKIDLECMWIADIDAFLDREDDLKQ